MTESQDVDDEAVTTEDSVSEVATVRKSASRQKKKKSTAADGPRIGEIPRDAWPEIWLKDPLAVSREKRPTVSSRQGGTGSTATDKITSLETVEKPPGDSPNVDKPTAGAKSGSVEDWATILSGDALASEVKAIKSSLTDKMQSVSKYSGNYKEIQVDAAELVAIAGIVPHHPDAPSWKSNAKYVRDTAAEIVRTATANGDKFYKPTKIAYEKLAALLSGSKPPDVEEAADKVKFSELSSRLPMMRRMQRAYDTMKLTINTESLIKKDLEKVAQEATVMSFLTKIIGADGYDGADEAKYQDYVTEIVLGGVEVVEAAKNGDFKAYTEALNRADTACKACHLDYRQ